MDNTTYEFFIRRAWKCDRFQKGANTDTWELMLYKYHSYQEVKGKATEKKEKLEFERKFSRIKVFLENAIDNLLFRVAGSPDAKELSDQFLDLRNDVTSATDPESLYTPLRKSFALLNENKL
ncbi:MAG: hypothetical protein V4635_15645 [Bacteroidota bacterium]